MPSYQDIVDIPEDCQMITVACPTGIANNQVTEILASNLNRNGLVLHKVFSQVVQAQGASNIAQSLIVASATAPTDFSNKANCFPIYRTFQNGNQTPVSLGGASPENDLRFKIPAGWGIWQIVNVVGAILSRNNVRLGYSIA